MPEINSRERPRFAVPGEQYRVMKGAKTWAYGRPGLESGMLFTHCVTLGNVVIQQPNHLSHRAYP